MILTLEGFSDEEKRKFFIEQKERDRMREYLDKCHRCRNCRKISVSNDGDLCEGCYQNHAAMCGAV